ncbi:LacI family DNA-binding transcriptional regulator [Auraticoccus monumenti]|uniref:DNA-binding transcriptional regulator, LacI/PurR family n=1 Tax=Auraticoccus monumenti TaxID=675864 RepID=A0A1G6TTL8_9ACTN|nr:LacI family DNA-binding transcriptional regulator [Auraticoccus monumenti]SDD31796.1 DNA-binding transcriptional regulator, LacI/PurR family [Auraticoccus monumenti]
MAAARVTIEDVARRAGVSNMTVSNVVNRRPGRVGEATRQRVQQAIDELGYRVNVTARQLRSGRTGTVGLAVPELTSGYFVELGHRLAERLAAHGLRLVLERTAGDLAAELDALSASRLDAYDGFVLSVVAGDAEALDSISPATPVVLIGEQTVPDRFDHVLMDNVDGARQATAALLASGARRIVLLGGSDDPAWSMPRLRTQGYRDAHRRAGAAVDEELVRSSSFTAGAAQQVVTDLAAEGRDFDAVFALTDSAALGALRALADLGRAVPGEVQVVGFDDVAAGRFSTPRLSTVDPGNEAMADAICDLLLERMAGDVDRPARVVMPPARLVLRESTRFS